MPKGLLERLTSGEGLVVAEGYLFEFERRGYLKAGTFVPEVVLERPDLVKQMYEEFVHAGSEVVLALTFYANPEKLRLVGREEDYVSMNRTALRLARDVADDHGCLMAGNICQSTVYVPDDVSSHERVKDIFKVQIELAVEQKADFILGETFMHVGEALIALECIKKHGAGVPAVITMSAPVSDTFIDGYSVVEGCKLLEKAGADVVGLNCARGPMTMLPLIKELKQACSVPIAALPVPYRTTTEEPTFFSLKCPDTGKNAFPFDLTAFVCTRTEVSSFAEECRKLGVEYVGLCCGNSANMTRLVAEKYGKTPPACRFSPEMEKHFIFGDKANFNSAYTVDIKQHISGDFK